MIFATKSVGIGLVVRECIRKALRCLLDELLVAILPPDPVVHEPLSALLPPLRDPGAEERDGAAG